jgi:hypothetical protein
MASDADDIDAGWDEPTIIQPALSSAARRPAPSVPPVTPAVAARSRGLASSSESLSPSTNTVVTVARSRPPLAHGPFVAKLTLAAALAATMGFTLRRATLADAPPSARNEASARASETKAKAATAPTSAATSPRGPAPAVLPPAAGSPVTPPPVAPASIPTVNAASLAAAEPSPVSVRVKSIPEGAIFFEGGKRLGTSLIDISVEPRAKRYFTALLNGYEPLNFKVDGTRTQLSVRLTPALPAEPRATSEPQATSEPLPEQ